MISDRPFYPTRSTFFWETVSLRIIILFLCYNYIKLKENVKNNFIVRLLRPYETNNKEIA